MARDDSRSDTVQPITLRFKSSFAIVHSRKFNPIKSAQLSAEADLLARKSLTSTDHSRSSFVNESGLLNGETVCVVRVVSPIGALSELTQFPTNAAAAF